MLKKIIIATSLFSSSLSAYEIKHRDDFSIEDLLKLQVVTASKDREDIFSSSSAVSIITNADIKKSGVTNIPEALRLAPGVQVARIDSNKYAISIRGFNRQFSNKLLVLVDGRSVYNNLFSGVYWDEIDYPLDDIDRIEVVRGASAALWGVNAVNGVINIITKNAEDTQGVNINLVAGNYDNFIGDLRYGGKIDEKHKYRFYYKRSDKDSLDFASNSRKSQDSGYFNRAGFRFDSDDSEENIYSVQVNAYQGTSGQEFSLPDNCATCASGATFAANGDEDVVGGNFLFNFNKEFNSSKHLDVNATFDIVERKNAVLEQDRASYQFDAQYNYVFNNRNKFITGLEYRGITDSLKELSIANSDSTQVNQYLDYTPNSLTYNTTSAFFSNKTTLVNRYLYLTLASRFSYDDFSKEQVQPTAKLSYLVNNNNHFWISISRASRTPTRAERGLSAFGAFLGGNDIFQQGSNDYQEEKVTSYELGYKFNIYEKFLFDISSFYSKYKDARAFIGTSATEVQATNNGEADSYGLEASLKWDILKNWQMSGDYSFLQIHADLLEAGAYPFNDHLNNEVNSPEHQISLRSNWNITDRLRLDNIYYYVDGLDHYSSTTAPIDSYNKFDSQVSYNVNDELTFSLIGQNIFDKRHQEFFKALYGERKEVGRYVAFKINYKF